MTATSRLRIGIDVPWVTSWSEEAHTGVGRCASVDGELAVGQQEQPGHGRPLYSRNHLFRQRRTVREMLCPMCGRATLDGDRWSQTGQETSANELRGRGFGWALPEDMPASNRLLSCGNIAPLHLACAEAALERCPHLGRAHDKTLKVFPPTWIVIPLWIEAKLPPPRGSVRAVSFLQLVGVRGE